MKNTGWGGLTFPAPGCPTLQNKKRKMKDRILQLMKREKMTQQEFSRATGISPASLSSIFNGRTAPTLKHVEALNNHFPALNMQWLLFGNGEMFNSADEGDGALTPEEGTDEQMSGAYPEASQVPPSGMSPAEEAFKGLLPSTKGLPPGTVVLGPTDGIVTFGDPISIGSGVSGGQKGGAKRNIAPGSVVIPQNGASSYTNTYAREGEKVNILDKKPRKIVEIRIFFDDGTFETFKGN